MLTPELGEFSLAHPGRTSTKPTLEALMKSGISVYFRLASRTTGPAVGAGYPVVLSATQKLAELLLGQTRDAEAVEVLSAAEAAARKSYTGSNERSLGEFLQQLGRAQARLGRHAAAEATLLEAHDILSRARPPTESCARLLAELYSAWHREEPGKGHDAKAASWRAKLSPEVAPMPRRAK